MAFVRPERSVDEAYCDFFAVKDLAQVVAETSEDDSAP
jgi:hypothetical protein